MSACCKWLLWSNNLVDALPRDRELCVFVPFTASKYLVFLGKQHQGQHCFLPLHNIELLFNLLFGGAMGLQKWRELSSNNGKLAKEVEYTAKTRSNVNGQCN